MGKNAFANLYPSIQTNKTRPQNVKLKCTKYPIAKQRVGGVPRAGAEGATEFLKENPAARSLSRREGNHNHGRHSRTLNL